MQFRDWFRQQQEAGLTQKAFAAKIDVTQGRIAQLLSGDLPSWDLANRIAIATAGKVTATDWARAASDEAV